MAARLRDLGISIGEYSPGPFNAITDVPGVLVGQTTLVADDPTPIRTGVTAIFPRSNVHQDYALGAYHRLNGIGEMTGLPFLDETGMLVTPVVLTNTNQVGLAYDAMVRYGARKYGGFAYKLPVIAETYDGWLNDINTFPLREEHVVAALESAASGPVAEGSTGGGTGMTAYEFKAGTGTASRRVELDAQPGEPYTVGVLVQANHGDRRHLRVDGVPVGKEISAEVVPLPWPEAPVSSSIIIVIATDAPLLPHQCKRLAQRATVGLARTGGYGLASSGDLFLAFSTGNHFDLQTGGLVHYQAVPQFGMDDLVLAAAEAVEEAIINSMVAAETMTGYQGHTAFALPHDLLLAAMRRYNRHPE